MSWVYALLSLLGGLFGGYLGAYVRKKGENLATKEDIAQITRIQHDIQNNISNEFWMRQRNWDMKREAAFELMREAAVFQESVVRMVSSWRAFHLHQRADEKVDVELAKANERYQEAVARHWRAKAIAGLLLGEQVMNQANKFEAAGRAVTNLITADVTDEQLTTAASASGREHQELMEIVRKELSSPEIKT
jgi:hypothetical protein